MGASSGINYVDASWGPWRGCNPVSAGCEHCYAERMSRRSPQLYPNGFGVVTRASNTTFYAPLKWKTPRVIFVCPWSDYWHSQVSVSLRNNAYQVMALSRQHTFLIPTKRPSQIPETDNWDAEKHIWLGVTIENAATAHRWTTLVERTGGKGHVWISFEPLLSFFGTGAGIIETDRRPDWIVIGCESGAKRRPVPHYDIYALIRIAQTLRIPVWLKQICENADGSGRLLTKQGDIARAFGECPRERPF